jgi:D-3-phosphoglycerate dehydrogenase
VVSVFVSHPLPMQDMYFGAAPLAALRRIADVRCNPASHDLSEDELIAAARDCDAIVAYRQTVVTGKTFEALPRLAVLLRNAVDVRTIDIEAASAHGVLVTRASAGFNPAVAEWVIAVTIDLLRGIGNYRVAYLRGESPVPVMGRELHGATLGIIGYGGIGRYVGALALSFGARVLVTTLQSIEESEHVRQVALGALLAQSDVVVCLAPATPATVKLMDAAAFAAMRPDAFFVNAARGELVDEAALLAALDAGRIAGSAIDVGLAPDQMPSAALARHPKVIATPHVGGLTRPAVEHQAMENVAQLEALVAGRVPVGCLNLERATRWRLWRKS